MNDSNVIPVGQGLAERMRLSKPARAQDVLDLAVGLAELVSTVRALALRVQQLEHQYPEFELKSPHEGGPDA